MHNIPYFVIPFFVWCCAQFTKLCIDMFSGRQITWQMLWASGGFPSTHGTLTSSMVTLILLVEWWNSLLFMVVTVVSMLVWYDAANVRYESGKHAQYINSLKKEINQVFVIEQIHPKISLPALFLKERIGHTPIEVLAGIAYGTSMTSIIYLLLNYFL